MRDPARVLLDPMKLIRRARRRMVAEGATASTAAYDVGYESVPQFTREYRRMFGMPPMRDVSSARLSA